MRIQKARCKPRPPACLLEVEATSTNFNAVLTVYSETGAALFQLNNNGGGKYSGSNGFITRPNRIEVRSNFGGRPSRTWGPETRYAYNGLELAAGGRG